MPTEHAGPYPGLEMPTEHSSSRPGLEMPTEHSSSRPGLEMPTEHSSSRPGLEMPTDPAGSRPGLEMPTEHSSSRPGLEMPTEHSSSRPGLEMPTDPAGSRPGLEMPTEHSSSRPGLEMPTEHSSSRPGLEMPTDPAGSRPGLEMPTEHSSSRPGLEMPTEHSSSRPGLEMPTEPAGSRLGLEMPTEHSSSRPGLVMPTDPAGRAGQQHSSHSPYRARFPDVDLSRVRQDRPRKERRRHHGYMWKPFRPDFKEVNSVINEHPEVPRLALSATPSEGDMNQVVEIANSRNPIRYANAIVAEYQLEVFDFPPTSKQMAGAVHIPGLAPELFDSRKLQDYTYEVIGGNHTRLALQKLHSEDPDEDIFKTTMARVYCDLPDSLARKIGIDHNKMDGWPDHDPRFSESVDGSNSEVEAIINMSVPRVNAEELRELLACHRTRVAWYCRDKEHVSSNIHKTGAALSQRCFKETDGVMQQWVDDMFPDQASTNVTQSLFADLNGVAEEDANNILLSFNQREIDQYEFERRCREAKSELSNGTKRLQNFSDLGLRRRSQDRVQHAILNAASRGTHRQHGNQLTTAKLIRSPEKKNDLLDQAIGELDTRNRDIILADKVGSSTWIKPISARTAGQSPVPLGGIDHGAIIYPYFLTMKKHKSKSPAAFFKELMSLYFSEEELFRGNLMGGGNHEALNPAIIAAILGRGSNLTVTSDSPDRPYRLGRPYRPGGLSREIFSNDGMWELDQKDVANSGKTAASDVLRAINDGNMTFSHSGGTKHCSVSRKLEATCAFE
ncbi:Hypp6718 [Branchiostoma lanceolatum]|uniref:Hypp6718 protein n=1 Tax=Branchiostoma lanceolatum TaxID=7740 RepID=A0A8J9YVB4_BRALA|nr:Hypp6718 [Branchiostoma lanceolatum]